MRSVRLSDRVRGDICGNIFQKKKSAHNTEIHYTNISRGHAHLPFCRKHTRTHTYIHTHTRTHTHCLVNKYQSCTSSILQQTHNTHIYTQIHTHTYVHTHIHTQTHTYAHIWLIFTRSSPPLEICWWFPQIVFILPTRVRPINDGFSNRFFVYQIKGFLILLSKKI